MHSRKLVSIWALLALMLGQVTLAQHSASHIDHGFSQEITVSHNLCDEHQHDKEDQKHECPECLLTKSLQAAFYNTPVTLAFALKSEVLRPQQYSVATVVNRYNSNSPRAPPVTLI